MPLAQLVFLLLRFALYLRKAYSPIPNPSAKSPRKPARMRIHMDTRTKSTVASSGATVTNKVADVGFIVGDEDGFHSPMIAERCSEIVRDYFFFR